MNEALHQLMWSGRILAVALVLLAIGWLVRRRASPFWAVPFAVAGGVLALFAVTIPLVFLRPVPGPADQFLFEGVHYERRIVAKPVRQVCHIVTIALDQPGLRVLVTPPEATITNDQTWQVPARTTTEFLEAFDQQLAVNANYYFLQKSYGIFYYYPRSGDGVNLVGRALSGGRPVGDPDPSTRTIWFADGRAAIAKAMDGAEHAVSGYPLLEDGNLPPGVKTTHLRHPRVAIGVDRSGRTLFIVVIDGRVPFYSDGASVREVGELIRNEGAWDAILLDGGGSAGLVRREPSGRPVRLNLPVHGRMPAGFERPNANHIGFSGLRPAE